MSTCTVPFDSGPRLCQICQLSPAARPEALLVAGRREPGHSGAHAQGGAVRRDRRLDRDPGRDRHGQGSARAGAAREQRPAESVVRRGERRALPAELLESELFGHARGAFTGAAAAKQGLFEAADGGSLLLDEIGKMPLALQSKLLRVLQDGEIRRVGETKSFGVKVRVMCATHQQLQDYVTQGRFRQDLYYRLKVFVLTVPPLRKR